MLLSVYQIVHFKNNNGRGNKLKNVSICMDKNIYMQRNCNNKPMIYYYKLMT